MKEQLKFGEKKMINLMQDEKIVVEVPITFKNDYLPKTSTLDTILAFHKR